MIDGCGPEISTTPVIYLNQSLSSQRKDPSLPICSPQNFSDLPLHSSIDQQQIHWKKCKERDENRKKLNFCATLQNQNHNKLKMLLHTSQPPGVHDNQIYVKDLLHWVTQNKLIFHYNINNFLIADKHFGC